MPSIKDFASGRSDIHNVDPRKIKIKPGWNLRFSGKDLDEHIYNLSVSIRNNGFLKSHPIEIVIENGEVFVVDGECRLTAVMKVIATGVDIKTVPCVLSQMNDQERAASLLVHNSGKPFTPLEQAVGYVRLAGYGWDIKEIAAKVAMSETHIVNMLTLAKADEATKELIRNKAASATAVVVAMRETGGDATAAHKKIEEQVKKKGKATIASVKGKKASPAVGLRITTKALRQILERIEQATPGQEPAVLRVIQAYCENALDASRSAEISAAGETITNKARSNG